MFLRPGIGFKTLARTGVNACFDLVELLKRDRVPTALVVFVVATIMKAEA